MLIEKEENSMIIRFNKLFYDIDSIIAANTYFKKDFFNEVSFCFSNLNPAMYHIVKLIPKKTFTKKKIYDYINYVLNNENNSSNKQD